ncbi:thioredoxin-disulfide reductase [Asticcacaulis biprosthecium C19]|uniref:Thioredoxin reductase n=1 Tax=Asticcacaulis biprosthecium C19 TaxID=715226 RepID=F4QKB9_9CAUL|nr:thioredoxin-disulfide reductase [Asticcacaulis biprosthecium]EGF93297.1 thioredoxin-disulfide reductase [Asticcacaulis biprosthecium C19]
MSDPRKVRCAIIGTGPAGWTAAIYAARGLLSPVIFTGPQDGGQLTITTDVENYPGFAEVIQGPWLMDQMRDQAVHMGTEVIAEIVTKADLSQRPFRLETEAGNHFLAETVIIATGAQAKWLGIESEKTYQGFGVSACATCDGFFYRNKAVAVVGGGNTAVEEALFLTKFASKVYLIHRREQLRAEKILVERLLNHPKIEPIWNVAIDEILGDRNEFGMAGVTGVRLSSTNGGEDRVIDLDGVFIAIGHAPSSQLFEGQLETKQGGYLVVEPGTPKTSIPGVFAAGDVTDDVYRQAVTAAGMGCQAALEAIRLLAEEDHHHSLLTAKEIDEEFEKLPPKTKKKATKPKLVAQA